MNAKLRFGVAESHGRGAALQLNTYLGDNSVIYDTDKGKYQVRVYYNLNISY